MLVREEKWPSYTGRGIMDWSYWDREEYRLVLLGRKSGYTGAKRTGLVSRDRVAKWTGYTGQGINGVFIFGQREDLDWFPERETQNELVTLVRKAKLTGYIGTGA